MQGSRHRRRRARDQLAVHPHLAATLSRASRLVGARSVSAKLHQLSTELVRFSVPEDAAGRPGVELRMQTRSGRDQIAMHLQSGGWRAFEWPMPSVFAACVGRFLGVTVDVGANTGFYSVVAAGVNTRARVIAFEPFAPVVFDLRSTLAMNRCATRVTVVTSAVSDAVGEATLFIPMQDHGLIETSASLSVDFKGAFSETLRVPVTTLDAYDLAEPAGRVTVIKVDVESFEAQVLEGATRLIARDRPIMFCEVLPQGDADRIDALRSQHRYVDVRLHDNEAIVGEPVRFDERGWNHALVPEERVADVVVLLGRIGLPTRVAS